MAPFRCECGAIRGSYTSDCEACRRRALKAEESRRRRARARRHEPLIRLPEDRLDELREQVRLVREAENDYNELRSTGGLLTPRETVALQGLGAAIELADLIGAWLPPKVSRLRNRTRRPVAR